MDSPLHEPHPIQSIVATEASDPVAWSLVTARPQREQNFDHGLSCLPQEVQNFISFPDDFAFRRCKLQEPLRRLRGHAS
jgi:hypothetical protein